jgi:hypothetical protein
LSQNLYRFTNTAAPKTEIEKEYKACNACHILRSNLTKLSPKNLNISTYDLFLASHMVKALLHHCKSIIYHVPNYTGTFKVKCEKTDNRHDLREFNCASFHFCTVPLK